MTIDPIITRIQALLAKAESTTFEAERETFLAIVKAALSGSEAVRP